MLMFSELLRRLRGRGFRPRDQATVEDVIAAYRLLLNREPDPRGFETYRRMVARGLRLDDLSCIFLSSDEFKRITAQQSEVTPVDLGGYSVCCRQSDPDFGQSIIATRQY